MQEYLKCGNRYPRPIRKQEYLSFPHWPAGEVVKFMFESEISLEKHRLLPEVNEIPLCLPAEDFDGKSSGM